MNKDFTIIPIDTDLPTELSFQILSYSPISLKKESYLVPEINKENEKVAVNLIQKSFKSFVKECLQDIPASKSTGKIHYTSHHGFLSCLMPDGSEVVTLNCFIDEGHVMQFAWLGEECEDLNIDIQKNPERKLA